MSVVEELRLWVNKWDEHDLWAIATFLHWMELDSLIEVVKVALPEDKRYWLVPALDLPAPVMSLVD